MADNPTQEILETSIDNFKRDETHDSNEISKRKRGFAAMDPAKRKQVASKGGKISRGGGRTRKKQINLSEIDERNTVIRNKRGFASMDPERRKEIASVGGRASHGGGRPKKKRL